MASLLAVGSNAPDATLPNQNGTPTKLSDVWRQGPTVVYFYPKDDTPGCTKEACSFRDSYEVFTAAGAKVVGISSDDVAAHKKFAEKYRLPFTLLSDSGGQVRAQFGVPKTLGLLDGRVTFVIDQSGVVRHVYSSQLFATKHVAEALAVVKTLKAA
jgi:peroxiredoxin Q/BCP